MLSSLGCAAICCLYLTPIWDERLCVGVLVSSDYRSSLGVRGHMVCLIKKKVMTAPTQIAAQVSYDAATDTATLNPNNNLKRGSNLQGCGEHASKGCGGQPARPG